MSDAARRPGRPRDSRLDDAILEAGLAVILERGYHAATLTEIARQAGVGTPAIYRRWPTKAELAMDIMLRTSEPDVVPDTGSIRDDMVEFMVRRLHTWTTPLFRQLVFPVILEGHVEGALAADVREQFVGFRQSFASRVARSIEAGELESQTNPNQLVDLLMGTVAVPMLFFQDLPAENEAGSIVDRVLLGFARQNRVLDGAS
jgi:AcrR family transcriptional regulator